jgi:hypothetical protein
MRDREPVEIVAIALPVLIEAVVVTLFIAAGFVWLIVLATPGAPV